MKAPKGDRVPLDTSDDLELVMFNLDDPDTGALFWSEDNGYVLKLPDGVETESLPLPLYILGLCFFRLKYDIDFAQDMMAWSKRKPH